MMDTDAIFREACRRFDMGQAAFARGDRTAFTVHRLAHAMCEAAFKGRLVGEAGASTPGG
jgi:hypothetical protein